MLTGALDKRSDQIRNELEQAKKLREEAQQLLAEYQRKRKEAETEAKSILSAAEREAAVLRGGSQGQDRGICQPPHRDGPAEDPPGRIGRHQRGSRFRRGPGDLQRPRS